MNPSEYLKRFLTSWLLCGILTSAPIIANSQILIPGEVKVEVFSYTTNEVFPCGLGVGDFMKVNISLYGELLGTQSIDFKVWLDTPSNQHSSELLIEYPTQITTKLGQYNVNYRGRGLAGELNFQLASTSLKEEEAFEEAIGCGGVATIFINDLFHEGEPAPEMFDNCIVYFDVWLSNLYCVGSNFPYTMNGSGSEATNGACFQSPIAARNEQAIHVVLNNPFKNRLNVEIDEGVQSAELIDAQGRVVRSKNQITSSNIVFETSTLPKGMYFLQLAKESQRQVVKLVKAN